MALGAARVDVGWLVLQRGTVVVLLGTVAGLIASASVGPLLAHLLYGVSPRDPLKLLAGPSILALVALLAIWLPARRAMDIDLSWRCAPTRFSVPGAKFLVRVQSSGFRFKRSRFVPGSRTVNMNLEPEPRTWN